LIGASSRDVIFTSCAMESSNTAIAAALRATGVPPVQGQQTRAGRPWHAEPHIVTSQVEHSSVLNYCLALERRGLDRSGGFTPPDCSVDLRSKFGGRRPPLQAHGGINPPLRDPCYRVTYLPVNRNSLLNLAHLEVALTVETAVASLMMEMGCRRLRPRRSSLSMALDGGACGAVRWGWAERSTYDDHH
jgi:hypothetical protein